MCLRRHVLFVQSGTRETVNEMNEMRAIAASRQASNKAIGVCFCMCAVPYAPRRSNIHTIWWDLQSSWWCLYAMQVTVCNDYGADECAAKTYGVGV